LWSTPMWVAVPAVVSKEWAAVIPWGRGAAGRARTDTSISQPPREGPRLFACSRAPSMASDGTRLVGSGCVRSI
jgi:hypothetical protein